MMTVILIFGAAAGVILGLRHFKVLTLLPVILLVAAAAIADGVVGRLDPRITALVVLAAVVSPQIGYLISSIFVSYIARGGSHLGHHVTRFPIKPLFGRFRGFS
jgi:hypothetical protein